MEDKKKKKDKDSVGNIFLVATLLCIVCSVLVSGAAVQLRPIQEKNKVLDRKKNILMAAGLYQKGDDVQAIFKNIETKLINLETGLEATTMEPSAFIESKAIKDPKLSIQIPADKDIGDLKKRTKYIKVYMVKEAGQIKQLIVPIKNRGLWGSMYAFMALGSDLNTVTGFAYYQHIETPGLGAEVDNPNWRGQWVGKKIFSEEGDVAINVLKGKVNRESDQAVYQVDGLTGATITTKGVATGIQYWFSHHGIGKYLANLRQKKEIEVTMNTLGGYHE